MNELERLKSDNSRKRKEITNMIAELTDLVLENEDYLNKMTKFTHAIIDLKQATTGQYGGVSYNSAVDDVLIIYGEIFDSNNQ